MLKEFKNPRQNENEIRRVFYDDYFDLYVWYDDGDNIKGFQLCYDKDDKSRAFTWHRDFGYSHMKVDDGEYVRLFHKMKPILVPDGIFNFSEIAERFKNESAQIDETVSVFVYNKILEYK